MPTTLTIDEHLAALEDAVARLDATTAAAGDAAPVPTCPGWDARALLAHVVMVHDWAANKVEGIHAHPLSPDELRAGGDDLHPRFLRGARQLVDALAAAPDDLQAKTFLLDAPTPRRFWARRQAHETTIHAVDGMAAALGRMPTAAEADISRDLAVDGIDELLCGFVPRGHSEWHVDRSYTVAVRPSDATSAWVLHVDDDALRTEQGDTAAPADIEHPDAVWSGTAAQLYLGLWNRGDEVVETTTDTVRGSLLADFAATQSIHW